jgi:hypothetical protein
VRDESETVSGPMLDPAHPGELVRHEWLEPLGLSVAAGAEALGVSRKTLDNLVNGRAGVSLRPSGARRRPGSPCRRSTTTRKCAATRRLSGRRVYQGQDEQVVRTIKMLE